MASDFDVLIIGGGLAGLSAATIIQRTSNLKIGILEASSRVGGRTSTLKSSLDQSTTVDVGGQWIGPTQTKMLALMSHFNLSTENQTFSIPAVLPDGTVRPRFIELFNSNLAPLLDEEQNELMRFEKRIDELCKQMDVEQPWLLDDAEALDSLSLTEFVQNNVTSKDACVEVLIYCQGILACDPHCCSTLFFIFVVASGGGIEALGDGEGGAQQWRIRGGSQQISIKIAEELTASHVDIMYDSPVCSVSRSEDNKVFNIISNHHDNDKLFTSRFVIFALSPVLASSIKLSTDIISPTKSTFFKSFHPGKCIKIIILYRESFWKCQHDGHDPLTLDTLSNNFCIPNLFTTEAGPYVGLVGLITGNSVDRYLAIPETQRQREVLKQLSIMYHCSLDTVNNFVEFFEKNWTTEAFSPGCFTGTLPPYAITRYGKTWRENDCPCVFWASTEMSPRFYGYMEGAVRSGEQAAHDLLNVLSTDEIQSASNKD